MNYGGILFFCVFVPMVIALGCYLVYLCERSEVNAE